MGFEELLQLTQGLPLFDSELLRVAKGSGSLDVQLSRWKKAGKVKQLKKGVYLVDQIYRKIEPFPFYVAGVLQKPSYISLHKALEYYDFIPERVTVYTSVTTKRPGTFDTDLGVFDYRHIQESLFWGYSAVTINQQTAFVAKPEKALLDFFYLYDGPISMDFLEGLRLQNLETINKVLLDEYAGRFNKPKIFAAIEALGEFMDQERKGERIL